VSTTQPTDRTPESWRTSLVGRVAVAVLTVLPLLPTLRARFVYDDTTVIRDNEILRGWGALARVWTSPYWPTDGPHSLGLYRPLQLALLAFVWNLGSGMAAAFHVYALTLALAVSLAVWWMLRRGAQAVPALIAAIWFAAQPLHVEAIASVANTSELVVVLAIVGMVRVLWASSGHDSLWRAAVFGVLAAAAIAAKESGLFAVPLAALTAWGWRWPGDHEPPIEYMRARARYWGAALIGVAAVIAARLVVLGAPVSNASIAAQGLDRLTTSGRVLAMMSLWPRIAAMVTWPFRLAPYYGPTLFPEHRALFALAGAILLFVLCAVVAVALRAGDRRPLVAAGWMVLSYLPASNLLTATGQILSDRTLFGVTVGAALMLAWWLEVAGRHTRRAAQLLFVVLLAHNLFVGARYAVAWTSHRTLWERLREVSPNEHMSYKLLGMDARGRGEYLRADSLLSRALSMVPTDRQVRFELGQSQYSAGAYPDAVHTLEPLLRDADARSERGFIALYLESVGRSGGARAVIAAARPLMRSESAAVAALFLGTALQQVGETAAADSAYAAGLRRSPTDTTLALRLMQLRGH
jgi:hypothetical protein